MKSISLIVLVVATIIAGCSPKFTYTWKDTSFQKNEFKKILIHGITDNEGKATLFEVTMVDAFKSQGIEAISSSIQYGAIASNEDPDKKIQKLLDDGIDAVLTIAVVDKNTETVYNQGATYSVPSYGRTYRGYSYRTTSTVQEPGYYTQETTYLLETNFYALEEAGDEDLTPLVWSAQSEESEPSNAKKFNQKYCELIITQMKEDGIL
ncbi:MAG: hypothetical protein OCD76_03450 [Reichenbachiella sp.]